MEPMFPYSDDGTRTHVTGVKILCDNHLHYNGIFCSTSSSRCSLGGSNSRLSAHKTDALPTELSEQKLISEPRFTDPLPLEVFAPLF